MPRLRISGRAPRAKPCLAGDSAVAGRWRAVRISANAIYGICNVIIEIAVHERHSGNSTKDRSRPTSALGPMRKE